MRSGTPQVYRSYRPARVTIAVEDKETKDPLIGATVSIISGADTLRGTTSKKDFYRTLAVYECDRIFRDSVDLEVAYLGYKPYKKRFAATEFRSRIEVGMEVDEQSIAQVVVVGKRVAMVFKGDTMIYNAGAFKTMADDRFEELLKQLPGVEVRDNKILAGGEEVKRVLIDGKNLFGNKSQYALTDLEASDVKSVRVYEELSPEAKRLGNTTARKEKVMNVETKSKRSVLQGGSLEASVGASLEKDYSGRREIRHSEAGTYYRNSEKGNWRIEASNLKDDNSRAEGASFDSKLTPTKQTDAQAEYTYRRGDSTSVSTAVGFQRRRQSRISRSMTEYFPTDDYALRTEENSGESLSKALSANLSNLTSIRRGKNSFLAMTDFSFANNSSLSRNSTSQRIDDDETRTLLNNDSDNRNLSFNIRLNYYISLSEKSSLSFWVNGDYGTQDQDGWQIDTGGLGAGPASQTAQQRRRPPVRFRNIGRLQLQDRGESPVLGRLLLQAQLRPLEDAVRGFSRRSAGNAGPRELLQLHERQLFAQPASRPELQPRRTLDHRHPHGSGLSDRPQRTLSGEGTLPEAVLPAESLVQPYDRPIQKAVHPQHQLLFADDPDRIAAIDDRRHEPPLAAGRKPRSQTAERHGVAGKNLFQQRTEGADLLDRAQRRYTFNYIASQRILFLEETYLPQYDYTARKGAQLSTQTNVGGCYKLGGSADFSQQIASLRSTVSATIGYDFQQTPYFLDETLCHSGRHALSFRAGFESGFSSKVKIAVSSVTSMSSYSTQNSTTQDLRETVRTRLDLRFGKYFASVANAYEFYCNSNSHTLTRLT